MVAQLNRFMVLLTLCGLLTRPAIAVPDGDQTLVVDGDTLVVQMAEPLPTGYQTLVVDGDTLMVQVLAEPLPTDDPPLSVSDDSLSAQKRVLKTSPQAAVRDSGDTTGEPDRHLLDSVFMGDPFRSMSVISDSTQVNSTRNRHEVFGLLMGGIVGAALGISLAAENCEGIGCGAAVGLVGSLGGFVGMMVGLGLVAWAADPPDQVETPSTSDEARQISVGIVPDTKGRLSAVATLRF